MSIIYVFVNDLCRISAFRVKATQSRDWLPSQGTEVGPLSTTQAHYSSLPQVPDTISLLILSRGVCLHLSWQVRRGLPPSGRPCSRLWDHVTVRRQGRWHLQQENAHIHGETSPFPVLPPRLMPRSVCDFLTHQLVLERAGWQTTRVTSSANALACGTSTSAGSLLPALSATARPPSLIAGCVGSSRAIPRALWPRLKHCLSAAHTIDPACMLGRVNTCVCTCVCSS